MKGTPIPTVPLRSQIECLCPRIEGRACVVLGSAPLSTSTADVAIDEVLIAVNGAISSAPRPPDLWFVGSKAQDKPGNIFIRPLHAKMLEQARNRAVDHIVFLRGPKVASEHFTIAALGRLNLRYCSWSLLDKATKRGLEAELCDRTNDKAPCSSGILAVASALYCGAASVRLIGFSFVPGYNYRTQERPQTWWRDHVEADKRALIALRARYGAKLSGDLVEVVAA